MNSKTNLPAARRQRYAGPRLIAAGILTTLAVTGSPLAFASPSAAAPVDGTARAVVPAALPAPEVTSPTESEVLTGDVSVIGSTAPYTDVYVYVDGKVAAVEYGLSGTFEVIVPEARWTPGAHVLKVKAVRGDEASAMVTRHVTYRAQPAEAPVVTTPEEGATTGLRPAVTGTGVTGATIDVAIKGGAPLGSTEVKGGTWTVTPGKDLPPGGITLQITQTVNGNPSLPVERTFTVLPAPVFLAPRNQAETPDRVFFEGTAAGAEGGTVELREQGGGEPLALLEVNADGAWRTEPGQEVRLDRGPHTVTAVATNADGKVSERSEVTFTVTGAPYIRTPAAGAESPGVVFFDGYADESDVGGKVELREKGSDKILASLDVRAGGGWWTSKGQEPELDLGTHTVTATVVTERGRSTVAEVTFTVTDAPYINAPRPNAQTVPQRAFSGFAHYAIGGRVELTEDGTVFATAEVKTDGTWKTSTVTLAPGRHTVTATALTKDGRRTAAHQISFSVSGSVN
ncbi:hypothetical protein [Streptomyces sp. NPDC050504]|uniref:hypothetical protein n=1 Tax=Streptomyces sp. NPDC050504 TaxID=3365618 RepID=UPI0037A0DD60